MCVVFDPPVELSVSVTVCGVVYVYGVVTVIKKTWHTSSSRVVWTLAPPRDSELSGLLIGPCVRTVGGVALLKFVGQLLPVLSRTPPSSP